MGWRAVKLALSPNALLLIQIMTLSLRCQFLKWDEGQGQGFSACKIDVLRLNDQENVHLLDSHSKLHSIANRLKLKI